MKTHGESFYSPAKWAEMQGAGANKEGLSRLREFQAVGVEWVEWLTTGTGDECPHCLAMSGKRMRIEDVKFTEHPHCEHERGCRCILIAVGDPNSPDTEEY